MNRLPAFLIIGTVVLLPFLYFKSTLDPVLVPRFLFLSALLFAVTITLLIRWTKVSDVSNFTFVRRLIVFAMLGYVIISGISLTRAVCISEGLFDFLKIAVSMMLFIVFASLLTGKRDYYLLISKATAITGIGLSIIAICQYYHLGFDMMPQAVVPYGTMANKNLLCSALFLITPMILFGWFKSSGFWKWVFVVSIALVLYVVVIGRTRAVWVAFAISIIVTTIITFAFRNRMNLSSRGKFSKFIRILSVVTVLILVVSIAFLTLSFCNFGGAFDKVCSHINTSDSSLRLRFILWERSLQIVADNPLLGCGIGNWKINVLYYGYEGLRSKLGKVFFQRPHNDFLWVLSETGPFGLFFYLSIFLIALYYTYKVIKESSDEDSVILSLLMICGVIGFLVISFFSFPRERIVHEVFVMLMISIIVSLYHRQYPSRRTVSRGFLLVGTIALLSCTICCLIVGCYRLNAEIHVKKARAAKSLGLWRTVISEIDKAYSPVSEFDPTSMPLRWYKGVANYSLNNIDEALEDFEGAFRINPYNIHVLNNLATCYEIKGDHYSAIKFYKKALEVYPQFDDPRVNLAAVYYNMGEYWKAYLVLMGTKGKSADPRFDEYMRKIKNKLEEKNHP